MFEVRQTQESDRLGPETAWFMNSETSVTPTPPPASKSHPSMVELIAQHPFTKGMSPKQINALADFSMEVEFKPGELVFREGDPANRFYLIRDGKVAIESYVEEVGIVPVQIVGAGDVLGWSWLFPPYYWSFDARAIEPCRAIFFYGTPLRDRCEEDHDLGYEMLKRMSAIVVSRLQATRKQLLKAQKRK